ncbi:AfsR/SARP family transcriptional regulator [Streptomyces fuscichromogenes]|uniref:SARP family transcriptional regulator n=1 Tax=Streptomyces fuscichromogenes TaxID=1324013 RepID=A0A917XE48_9ACTN|nr:BTAD domain-containing putative transcriptional regulator [Streptomyces fuscichromogenes]GGN13764.1 SARP family transcriptional regulator [Streptomyces fuscichromogenes]
MEARLRFAVLGPVRACRGSDEIELGPPQQQAVLAVLLLAEGSQVPVSGLIDAVWGTRAPATAPGIVRTYVHRLRKALEPAGDTASSVIRSTGDGYQLRVSPHELDVGTFRELVAQAEAARRAGDTKGAVGYLRDALGLWRGTALAGVRGEYAQAQRQRLAELRLSAEVARLTAELDLGAHAEAVAELTGLVAEHPLDERFRELLMLALYRSGRQAASLATYREAQTLLAGELGVDPGPTLQAMYQRVLRADAGLLTPSAPAEPVPVPARTSAPEPAQAPGVPAQLPAGLAVFVGRDAELAEVARLPSNGTVVISAIAGMAGVGKTTFAVHWARQVADRFPDGQLYLNLRGFDPVGQPVPPEHALRALLESLGAEARGLPQGADALAARYRTLLTGKRVLVLLDNAHDAAQVRPLLPGEPGCLVIVTSRNRLSGLVAVDGAHPLHLDLLSMLEARALLARRLGPGRVAAEPDAVEEIIERCARLPLALAVAAARAATRSALPLSAIAAELRDSADSLDAFQDADAAADVRAVFSWSYHALTPDAARLFRLLGLHPGPDVALPAAASLAGLTVPHVRQLLAELVQAHLVDEPAPGRYASHDLLRVYATELAEAVDPPHQVRAARYRMFDHYLHTAREGVALTFHRALISLAPVAEGMRAEDFAGDPAKARAWFTAEEAVLLAAVEQAALHRYDVHTWQLAWAVGHHLYRRGLPREREAVHRAAMEAARRLGDRTAQAYAHRSLGSVATDLGRLEEARVQIERSIELFTESGDMNACAESYRGLAAIAERKGDPQAGLDAAQRSLELLQAHAGRGGDDRRIRMEIATAFNAVGWFHTLLEQPQQALDHCRQALVLCQELGYDSGAADSWDSIGFALHRLGRHDEAVAAYRDALAIFQQGGGIDWYAVGTVMRLGDVHLSAGQPDAARAVWTDGLDVLERLGHADAEDLAVSLRTRLHRLDEPSGSPEAAAGLTDS